MDSPGLYDTRTTHEETCTLIIQAVAGMHPGPHAVLYVIQVGRFTAEDHAAYRRLKALFDDSIARHLVLLFTHGDKLEREGTSLARMMAVPDLPEEFKSMTKECGQRCLLFNNVAADPRPQVEQLLTTVRRLVADRGGRPYSCPKYSRVGRGLEEEVDRRMLKFEQRELQSRRYVQDLQRQTQEAEGQADRTRQEFLRKEQEREREASREQARREETERGLQQQLGQREHSLEAQRRELEKLKEDHAEQDRQRKLKESKASKEEKARLRQQAEREERREREAAERLQEQQRQWDRQVEEQRAETRRQERQQGRLMQKQEEQRRREVEEMDRKNRERDDRMERQRRAESAEEDRRQQARQREMERLQHRVVKNEEPGFFRRVGGWIVAPIIGFFKLFS